MGLGFQYERKYRVAENAEGKATEGGDGKYLYNTWDDGKGNVVSQVLSGMRRNLRRYSQCLGISQQYYLYFCKRRP